ncbi:hypothetical protein [Nocardia jiangsuensis]|uniref:hypothetical protein n=1 Tax=Nocardia jiangsuensis TaxID=1691563 RepID=UPI00366D56C7
MLHAGAADEHTERSLIPDLALALVEDRRRDIPNARDGRPRVVDAGKRRAILARHADGESLREIAREVGSARGKVMEIPAGATCVALDNPEQRAECPEEARAHPGGTVV